MDDAKFNLRESWQICVDDPLAVIDRLLAERCDLLHARAALGQSDHAGTPKVTTLLRMTGYRRLDILGRHPLLFHLAAQPLVGLFDVGVPGAAGVPAGP